MTNHGVQSAPRCHLWVDGLALLTDTCERNTHKNTDQETAADPSLSLCFFRPLNPAAFVPKSAKQPVRSRHSEQSSKQSLEKRPITVKEPLQADQQQDDAGSVGEPPGWVKGAVILDAWSCVMCYTPELTRRLFLDLKPRVCTQGSETWEDSCD